MKRRFLLLYFFFSGIWTLQAQVKIVCIGNSITQGKYSSGFYTNTSIGDSLKEMSYRFWLWEKLDSAGVNVTMVGYNTKYFTQGSNTVTQKSRYTTHSFVNNSEAYYGITSDVFLSGGWSGDGITAPNFDTRIQGYTADVACLHIGTNDNDANVDQTEANVKSIIQKLRSKNPNITILLAKLIEHKAIDDRISRIATEMTTGNSIVYMVDQQTGFIWNVYTLDGIHPNIIGQKHMAQRWYTAYQFVNQNDAAAPSVPKNFTLSNIKTTTIDLAWSASTDNVGVNAYNIYRDGVLISSTGLTKLTITNVDMTKSHTYTVKAVDYKKNLSAVSASIIFPVKITIHLKDDENNTLTGTNVYLNSVKKATDLVGDAVYPNLISGQFVVQVPVVGYNAYFDTLVVTKDTVINVLLTKKADAIKEVQQEISIYPNPAGGIIIIKGAEGSVLELYNSEGILQEHIFCNDTEMPWDISKYATGDYIINIKKEENILSRKIIIMR